MRYDFWRAKRMDLPKWSKGKCVMENLEVAPRAIDAPCQLAAEMDAAYASLAEDVEECDVEVFFAAQAEVMARDPA